MRALDSIRCETPTGSAIARSWSGRRKCEASGEGSCVKLDGYDTLPVGSPDRDGVGVVQRPSLSEHRPIAVRCADPEPDDRRPRHRAEAEHSTEPRPSRLTGRARRAGAMALAHSRTTARTGGSGCRCLAAAGAEAANTTQRMQMNERRISARAEGAVEVRLARRRTFSPAVVRERRRSRARWSVSRLGLAGRALAVTWTTGPRHEQRIVRRR
jgi:hypothetical protein